MVCPPAIGYASAACNTPASCWKRRAARYRKLPTKAALRMRLTLARHLKPILGVLLRNVEIEKWNNLSYVNSLLPFNVVRDSRQASFKAAAHGRRQSTPPAVAPNPRSSTQSASPAFHQKQQAPQSALIRPIRVIRVPSKTAGSPIRAHPLNPRHPRSIKNGRLPDPRSSNPRHPRSINFL